MNKPILVTAGLLAGAGILQEHLIDLRVLVDDRKDHQVPVFVANSTSSWATAVTVRSNMITGEDVAAPRKTAVMVAGFQPKHSADG